MAGLSACSGFGASGSSSNGSGQPVGGPNANNWTDGYQPTTKANVAGNNLEFAGAALNYTAVPGARKPSMTVASVNDTLPTSALGASYTVSAPNGTLLPVAMGSSLNDPGNLAALQGATLSEWGTADVNNVETLTTWTPTGSSNAYGSLASWVIDEDSDLSTPVNAMKIGAIGQRTGVADVPTSGTASFTGRTFGTLADSVSTGYSFNGAVAVDVDFSSGSMTGRISDVNVFNDQTGAGANAMLTGGTLTGAISGNSFSGSAAFTGGIASQLGSNALNSHNGGFFGPPSDLEVGGGFSAVNTINNANVLGGYLAE